MTEGLLRVLARAIEDAEARNHDDANVLRTLAFGLRSGCLEIVDMDAPIGRAFMSTFTEVLTREVGT